MGQLNIQQKICENMQWNWRAWMFWKRNSRGDTETRSFLSVLSPLISKLPTGCGWEDDLFTVFHRFDIFGSPDCRFTRDRFAAELLNKISQHVLLHLKMVISYGRTSYRFLSTVLSISSASNLKVLWELWYFIIGKSLCFCIFWILDDSFEHM